jgi:hypothetical protein
MREALLQGPSPPSLYDGQLGFIDAVGIHARGIPTRLLARDGAPHEVHATVAFLRLRTKHERLPTHQSQSGPVVCWV